MYGSESPHCSHKISGIQAARMQEGGVTVGYWGRFLTSYVFWKVLGIIFISLEGPEE